jgi:membrane-associated phospholipid phosphatase
VLPELSPDRWIGFHPGAAWVYLSFFLLQAVGFYCVPPEKRGALVKAFVTCAAFAFAVFTSWPTTLTQPPLSANIGHALAFVRWADTPGNCLPSLHAALSAVSAAAVSLGRGWRARVAGWSWAIAICWSAIATRQHLTVDIAAGWVLGCVVALMLPKGLSTCAAAAKDNGIPCGCRSQRMTGE